MWFSRWPAVFPAAQSHDSTALFCLLWPRNLPLCLNDFISVPHVNYLEYFRLLFLSLGLLLIISDLPSLSLLLSYSETVVWVTRGSWHGWSLIVLSWTNSVTNALSTCMYGNFFSNWKWLSWINICISVSSFGPTLKLNLCQYVALSISLSLSLSLNVYKYIHIHKYVPRTLFVKT